MKFMRSMEKLKDKIFKNKTIVALAIIGFIFTVHLDTIVLLFQNIVFQTVISGVLIFLVGEMIQNFFLKSIYKYREIIGRIDNQLKFYAGIISCGVDVLPKEKILECSHIIRTLSCELEAIYKQIPLKEIIIKSNKEEISDAASCLIRVSNNLGKNANTEWNDKDVAKIRKNLNIPEL